ncbi:MAG TPA: PIN domain-containing protein [Candidatus Paceibacterota bacterium]
MFTLDTNILVYYAAGDGKVTSFVFERLKEGKIFYVPTIVVVEFFSFPALGPKDSELFEYLFLHLDVTALDVRIAKIAGDLRKRYGLNLVKRVGVVLT